MLRHKQIHSIFQTFLISLNVYSVSSYCILHKSKLIGDYSYNMTLQSWRNFNLHLFCQNNTIHHAAGYVWHGIAYWSCWSWYCILVHDAENDHVGRIMSEWLAMLGNVVTCCVVCCAFRIPPPIMHALALWFWDCFMIFGCDTIQHTDIWEEVWHFP